MEPLDALAYQEHRQFVRVFSSPPALPQLELSGRWRATGAVPGSGSNHAGMCPLALAVIAVPDECWGERPLACVVLKEGAAASPEELCAHLVGRIAKWWIPDHWAFIDQVPRTSVDKYDKKQLRAAQVAGQVRILDSVPIS